MLTFVAPKQEFQHKKRSKSSSLVSTNIGLANQPPGVRRMLINRVKSGHNVS